MTIYDAGIIYNLEAVTMLDTSELEKVKQLLKAQIDKVMESPDPKIVAVGSDLLSYWHKEFGPKVFLDMEHVSYRVNGKLCGYVIWALSSLQELGYEIDPKLIPEGYGIPDTLRMQMPNYRKIFDMLYDATRKSDIDSIALHGGFIGTTQEYTELRTIRMGGIRQSGKTEWLISKLKSSPTFVGLFKDETSRSDAVRKEAPHLQVFGSLNKLLECLTILPNSVECIVIDEASTTDQVRKYNFIVQYLTEMNFRKKPIIVCLG